MSDDFVNELRERADVSRKEGTMTAMCDALNFEGSADRIEELGANLARAVEALENAVKWANQYRWSAPWVDQARATIA